VSACLWLYVCLSECKTGSRVTSLSSSSSPSSSSSSSLVVSRAVLERESFERLVFIFGVDLSSRSRARSLSDRDCNWRSCNFLDSIPARGLRALKVAAVSLRGLRTQTGGHRDTSLVVTDGVSTPSNGLNKSIFHALHDAINIRTRQPVGHLQFRPVQSSADRYA